MSQSVYIYRRKPPAGGSSVAVSGAKATQISLEALVAAHPGPALAADAEGAVLASNATASALAAWMADGNNATLRGLVRECALYGESQQKRLRLPGKQAEYIYDLNLIPIDPGGVAKRSVLMLAQDSTAEANFTKALVRSRQLFKDLVNCSADFAWETDSEGRFAFVSPRGAIGYTADDLNGRLVSSLLCEAPDGRPADEAPFVCRDDMDNMEVWLRAATGEPACLLVSSVPVRDEDDAWCGARGVCHDVTVEKRQAYALERADRRERLMRSIIDSIRLELTPEAMFDSAAKSTSSALNAQSC